MQKRGQMYLVAALIISTLLIGLGSIYNYARSSQEDKTIKDLSEEIDYETSRVIDRSVFLGEDIDEPLLNISDYYSNLNYLNELVIIFGNFTEITTYHYKLDEAGTVCIQTGTCSGIEFFTKMRVQPTTIQSGNSIKIILGEGDLYEFELISGQNFYTVLTKQDNEERFTVAPEQKR